MAEEYQEKGIQELSESIIVNKKVGKKAPGHNVAWKLAYADFVTAMMALFLLLWLLSSTNSEQRMGIANYFKPTFVSNSYDGSQSILSGKTMSDESSRISDSSPFSVVQRLIPRTTETAGQDKSDVGAGDRVGTSDYISNTHADAQVGGVESAQSISLESPQLSSDQTSVSPQRVEGAAAQGSSSSLHEQFPSRFEHIVQNNEDVPGSQDIDEVSLTSQAADSEEDSQESQDEQKKQQGQIVEEIQEEQQQIQQAMQAMQAQEAQEAQAQAQAQGEGDETTESSALRDLVAQAAKEAELERAAKELRQTIQDSPDLQDLNENVLIDQAPEGLRIQLIDTQDRPMFPLGSDQMHSYMENLLGEVAKAILPLPNMILLKGHTDSHPYRNKLGTYTNWELSTDRANASRRALVRGGIALNRIDRVEGLADREPLIVSDPFAAPNRRITILVLKREAAS